MLDNNYLKKDKKQSRSRVTGIKIDLRIKKKALRDNFSYIFDYFVDFKYKSLNFIM